jgi:uncharacterized protein (DUF952 family)
VIHHIALAADWQEALAAGEYRMSTVGRSLSQEGFVHAAFAHQLAGVAERYYRGVGEPLVLLTIDATRLSAEWRVEAPPGGGEGFPHVYGPVEVAAVTAVTPLRRDSTGRLVLPPL